MIEDISNEQSGVIQIQIRDYSGYDFTDFHVQPVPGDRPGVPLTVTNPAGRGFKLLMTEESMLVLSLRESTNML
jgi:hypothetical protein